MALLTWREMKARSLANPTGVQGPITLNPVEAKKAFDFYIAQPKWKNFSKSIQMKRIANLISLNLANNAGKFIQGPGAGSVGDAALKWDAFVKKNPKFPNYLTTTYASRVKDSNIKNILTDKNLSMEERFKKIGNQYRKSARLSFFAPTTKAIEGTLSLDEFAPYTNFKKTTLGSYLRSDAKFPRLKDGQINYANTETSKIIRGNAFREFLKSIGITQTLSGLGGARRFSIPDKEQAIALRGFLNLSDERGPSRWSRRIVERVSKNHPLYKESSQNLRGVLKYAQNNLNETIQGYNDKGLRKFLEKYPRILKSATMRFNPETLKVSYLSLDEAMKDPSKLRTNLKFEIDHNRPVRDYWKTLSQGNKISAKNALLNDAEFAHNLSLNTSRYNRSVKERIYEAANNPVNKARTAELAALEKEMSGLGYRYYSGGEFKGAGLDIKPSYRNTVLDSWSKALEKSTGLKWSDQLKNISKQRWTMAMQDVTMKPDQLRALGTFLGCPGSFKSYDEGGRVRLATGGQGLSACVSTKLKQPGAIEKIAALPEEVGGALGKLKNTATTFLGMLGRGGVRAAPYAAVAAAGVLAEPLVKRFRNDDPTTYMTDPDQQKGVLLSLVEAETPQVDEEILNWQYPGMVAGAAAAVPGSSAVYKARRKPFKTRAAMGPARAALGPVGKFLAGSFSPLGVAASLPVHIAAQVKGGAELEDIATDPLNWVGPAFASTGAKAATRGMSKTGILSKALRMGMSPAGLRVLSRGGIFGLLAAGGLKGYDIWENSKYK